MNTKVGKKKQSKITEDKEGGGQFYTARCSNDRAETTNSGAWADFAPRGRSRSSNHPASLC